MNTLLVAEYRAHSIRNDDQARLVKLLVLLVDASCWAPWIAAEDGWFTMNGLVVNREPSHALFNTDGWS